MRKGSIVILLAGTIFLSVAGCSSEEGIPSSHVESSQVSSTITSASSGAPANEQLYLDLLNPPMKELGETEVIKIVSIEEPSEGKDISTLTVHFSAGERLLQGIFSIEGTEVSFFSISSEEDPLHCYYCPGAEAANSLGVVLIRLYDYNTDELINQSAAVQNESEQQFLTIVESYPFAEVIEEKSNESLYCVSINLDTSTIDTASVDANGIAMMWYYQLQLFVSDICDTEKLNSFPSAVVGFYVEIDDENIGSLSMYTSPESGLFGTSRPIIVDERYRQAFSDMYDEYMMDTIDQSKFVS